MAQISQFIQAGSNFDGLAPNATFTDGGLILIPSARIMPGRTAALVQAQLSRIAFKTLGDVGDWTWVIRDPGDGILRYDNQGVNFTVGAVVTGAISGATAIIVSDADAGAAGILTLASIDETGGPFQDGERLTDDAGGAADADGLIVFGTQELDNGAETDYELRFNGDEGIVPNDPQGNPCPIVFVTSAMTLSGRATVEFEYVPVNS